MFVLTGTPLVTETKEAGFRSNNMRTVKQRVGRVYVSHCEYYKEGSVRTVILILHGIILINIILGAFAKLRKATVSFVMSVCPSALNISAPFEEF